MAVDVASISLAVVTRHTAKYSFMMQIIENEVASAKTSLKTKYWGPIVKNGDGHVVIWGPK